MRYGLLFPPPIGGGATPTPTPTASTRTFSPTNFGLSAVTPVTTGSVNTMGPASPGQSIGTTSADLDGLILSFPGVGKPMAINLFFGATQVCTFVPLLAVSAMGKIDLPIRIPSGTNIGIQIATNSSAASINVCPIGYQSSIPSDVTSIQGLGSTAAINAQGATLAAGAPSTWVEVGTLTAAAKGIAVIHTYLGNDTGRLQNTSPLSVDIGIGSAGFETVLIPNIAGSFAIANNIITYDQGPFRMPIANGSRLSARAKLADGSLPDAVSVQLAMMY